AGAPGTSKRRTVLNRAEHGHARVQPAIEIEVPCRNQEQGRAFGGIFAAELREIHVLANLQSPTPRHLVEKHSFVAAFFGLDPRYQMMLIVVRLEFSVRRIKARRIKGAEWRSPNKAKDNRRACISSSCRKERIHLR